MTIAYSVFADGLSQTPVFASPLDRGRYFNNLLILILIFSNNAQIKNPADFNLQDFFDLPLFLFHMKQKRHSDNDDKNKTHDNDAVR
jgi:hypothetical protein